MSELEPLVDYLGDIDALRLGASPWPEPRQGDQRLPIDWETLFPRTIQQVDDERMLLNDPWTQTFEGPIVDRFRARFGIGGDGLAEELREQSERIGWDVAAWYQPVHYFGLDWGVFIRESAVIEAALHIARFCRPAAGHAAEMQLIKSLIRAGVYIYFLHEQFHHKIECLGIRIEVATGKPAYGKYHEHVYSRLLGTDRVLEEALANADSYHRLSEPRYRRCLRRDVVDATRAYLRIRFPLDPPGYREARRFLTAKSFDGGENMLQAPVAEAAESPVRPIRVWDFAPRMTQGAFNVDSDIWSIVPAQGPSVLPLRRVALVRAFSSVGMTKVVCRQGQSAVSGGEGTRTPRLSATRTRRRRPRLRTAIHGIESQEQKGTSKMDAQEQHDEAMLAMKLKLNADASRVLEELLRTNASDGQDRSSPSALSTSEMQAVRFGLIAARNAPQGLLDAVGF